jgi:hypothetical protein
MRRLEKMQIEKKEAQDLKATEARSTCEEWGEYGHVHKDCPENRQQIREQEPDSTITFAYYQKVSMMYETH